MCLDDEIHINYKKCMFQVVSISVDILTNNYANFS